MSIESMAIALHHSRAKGTARLVLIGIANHDGDGGAWPSVTTLAHYAATDRRTAQRAIDKLVELREIVKDERGGGTHRTPEYSRPNLYHFILRCPPTCDGTKNHKTKGKTVAVEIEDLAVPDPPRGLEPARGSGSTPATPAGEDPHEPSTNQPMNTGQVPETTTRGPVDKSHIARYAPDSGYCLTCGIRQEFHA
jgi:hypothetical protein